LRVREEKEMKRKRVKNEVEYIKKRVEIEKKNIL